MDLDDDGGIDILSGCYPGPVHLFRKKKDGTYAKPVKLRDESGKEINPGRASAVFAFDWDGDGDLDLIAGDIRGNVRLVPNVGSPKNPLFGKTKTLSAAGRPIRVSRGDAGPHVADWDGDGRPDLLVGAGDGSVLWYRNTADKPPPVLDKPVVLVTPAPRPRPRRTIEGKPVPEPKRSPEALRSGMRAKIWVGDWNGDGLQDLLVGDFTLGKNKKALDPSITPEQVREARKKYVAAFKEYVKYLRPSPGETPEQKAERLKKLKKWTRERNKWIRIMSRGTPRPSLHGYVWVYLRKKGKPL